MNSYELDKARLVLEFIRVGHAYPDFRLKRDDGELIWEGELTLDVGGQAAEPLRIRLHYPEAFPATSPAVEVVQPALDPSEVGHAWHRWQDGFACYVAPHDWSPSYTADEVIRKICDWYFNYVAVKRGLIKAMPDIGRAEVAEETGP